MNRRAKRAPAAAALTLLLLASATGCGTGRTRQDTPSTAVGNEVSASSSALSPSARPPAASVPAAVPGPTLVAAAGAAQVQVFNAARAGAPPRLVLPNPNTDGAPLVFLVDSTQPGWVKVLLPARPNGSTGWVHARDVTLTADGYRLVVRRAAHRLDVNRGDTLLESDPIAVGTADTPTPGGRYYLTELLEQPNPRGPYGPYAYGLSGFSDVLHSFAGGAGVIGIHGTNQPELLGRDVSHGCIRVGNDAITRLSRLLPLGTPVTIQP